jgi:prepilin-type processing-associated H-X9-DG protein
MPLRHPESGVHLGFADGSVMELSATDPRANTFQAIARTLTQGHT